MVDNQHKLIKGYGDLSKDEIHSINEVKAIAAGVEELCNDLQKHADVDPRWLAIAKTDLQKGFMALVRCIAKSEGF